MNTLSLSFRQCEAAFREWLQILGYAKSSCYYLPLHLRAFWEYLHAQGIEEVAAIRSAHITGYLQLLSQRKHLRTGQPLSPAYLNKHLQALKLMSRYLQQSQGIHLEVPGIYFDTLSNPQQVLSKPAMGRLYAATQATPLGQRDRVMLMIYYGCGLRRGEGVALNLSDIHLSEGLIHVRRSKTGRARYVPLSAAAIGDLQIWCTEGRAHFTPLPSERALFLNPQGQRLSAQALAIRLKKLSQRAELDTEVSLHGLRHAIATHLLEAGMGIAYISRFLGHRSLESTQRYTHLHP